jgi:hypothetical protein
MVEGSLGNVCMLREDSAVKRQALNSVFLSVVGSLPVEERGVGVAVLEGGDAGALSSHCPEW